MQILKTKAGFDEALASNSGLVVVDFSADWCGPCRVIKPTLETMEKKYPNVAFFMVNVDENSETAEKCDIQGLPTFKFYKNGTEVDTLVGASESFLEDKIKRNQ
ncbi:thioredoxin-like [Haliotis rubra]|uniref:thioredoxin-like n=1 Tax=Haliotis rubra TaxID=36100 RepID=UPI001EE5BB47|nr:thioredoxin-like [Haliotis rubra]